MIEFSFQNLLVMFLFLAHREPTEESADLSFDFNGHASWQTVSALRNWKLNWIIIFTNIGLNPTLLVEFTIFLEIKLIQIVFLRNKPFSFWSFCLRMFSGFFKSRVSFRKSLFWSFSFLIGIDFLYLTWFFFHLKWQTGKYWAISKRQQWRLDQAQHKNRVHDIETRKYNLFSLIKILIRTLLMHNSQQNEDWRHNCLFLSNTR